MCVGWDPIGSDRRNPYRCIPCLYFMASMLLNIRSQDEDWPTQEVTLLREDGSNEPYQARVPVGNGCSSCVTGCKVGVGYLPWNAIGESCRGNEEFRGTCLRLSRVAGGEEKFTSDETERVTSLTMSGDTFQALYDGYTLEDFMMAHRGRTPGEMNIEGVEVEHPKTGQPLVVYFVPGTPSFRLTCGLTKFARSPRSNDAVASSEED